MSEFKHIDLKLVSPIFGSELTRVIMELNHLKKREIYGSTRPIVFFQVKEIFHYLESLASARIEGNRTTLSEMVEAQLGERDIGEKDNEILNINNALAFIDEKVSSNPINKMFLSEVHKIIVRGLSPPPTGEGCNNPGSYRSSQAYISGSNHIPPTAPDVLPFMEDLWEFINAEDSEQFDLIKIALAHHRFVWIHPFGNGNGRAVRMLTYAMLVKQGFNVSQCRILNPTAIFCNNRDRYYDMLSIADKGTESAYLEWCEYVINGLSVEIKKIDRLLNYEYLSKEILVPALRFIEKRKDISLIESKVASILVKVQISKSAELESLFEGVTPAARSQALKRMVERKILRRVEGKRGHFALEMIGGPLLRGIVDSLKEKGFVPEDIV